jgi:hypothetical protein
VEIKNMIINNGSGVGKKITAVFSKLDELSFKCFLILMFAFCVKITCGLF